METLMASSPVRPALLAKDEGANKKLTRGISRATDNVTLVSKARSEFALDLRDSGPPCSQVQYFVETPVFTFTLPDLTIYSDEFRAFLEKDLIETATLVSLEQAGRLNWWAAGGTCQRLWPLATSGDGNCLLHAASLGMWGFHDRLLTLRKALHATLTNGAYRCAIWRRWRWQQTLFNQEAGLVYCEEEWCREWDNLLRLSSTEPRSRPGRKSSCCNSPATKGLLDPLSEGDAEHDTYESLEEIHVLALAHVLRRPIIVVADTMLKDVTGEPFAPIPFGGIYLPLECPAQDCHKSPLVLTYDAAHFSALVAMEKESYADRTPQPPAVIPLTGPDHCLLLLQFAVDPGEDFHWGLDEFNLEVVTQLRPTDQDKLSLLHEYLDVVHISVNPIVLPPTLVINGHVEDKKSRSSGSFDSDDGSPLGAETSSRTKASKQLQSVARQFGSIGRSMSKKIKKNLGPLTRIGRSNSFKESSTRNNTLPLSSNQSAPQSQEREAILAAVLHTEKRHEYQEEMVRNYLHTAHERFERELRHRQQLNHSCGGGDTLPKGIEGPVQCVNPGCIMFGTAATSYLCTACFVRQKQQEQKLHEEQPGESPAYTLYGAGKSRFYAESDSTMFASISKMPVSRRPSPNQDKTLYLSKSTFYDDSLVANDGSAREGESITTGVELPPNAAIPVPCQTPKCQYFGSEEMDFLCSQCYKQQRPGDSPTYVLQLRTTHI